MDFFPQGDAGEFPVMAHEVAAMVDGAALQVGYEVILGGLAGAKGVGWVCDNRVDGVRGEIGENVEVIAVEDLRSTHTGLHTDPTRPGALC
jgi:hypothetical protein